MKKKDIIKALSASVTEYDVGNLLDCASCVHDCILADGFYINKSNKELLVESLATLSVMSKALTEKLNLSDEVEKNEESLIYEIIATIAAGESRGIEDEFDEFDDEDFDDEDFDNGDFDDEDFDFDIDEDFDTDENCDFDIDDEDSDFDNSDDSFADLFKDDNNSDEEESDDIEEFDTGEYIFEDKYDDEDNNGNQQGIDSVEFDRFLKAFKKFNEEDKKG